MRYNYDIPMRRFSPEHTIWGVSQLSAHYTGISVVPEIITDGTPSAVDTHLNSTIKYWATSILLHAKYYNTHSLLWGLGTKYGNIGTRMMKSLGACRLIVHARNSKVPLLSYMHQLMQLQQMMPAFTNLLSEIPLLKLEYTAFSNFFCLTYL